MHYDVVSSFHCDAQQVARARTWVQDELARRLPARVGSEVSYDAVLIVSELLTNAIRAGCGLATVGLALEPDWVRLGVRDDAPGFPTIRESGHNDHAGRGLPIVSALAQDWGIVQLEPPHQSQKEVWVTLALC